MQLPRQYPYSGRWRDLAFGALFFGAGAAFMGYKAIHNTVGLTINGLITLEPSGATVFYGSMAALGASFVLVFLALGLYKIACPMVLELTSDALVLPNGGWRGTTSRVLYAQMQQLTEVTGYGQRFLYVYAGGLRYTIVGSQLADAESYETIRSFLAGQLER